MSIIAIIVGVILLIVAALLVVQGIRSWGPEGKSKGTAAVYLVVGLIVLIVGLGVLGLLDMKV